MGLWRVCEGIGPCRLPNAVLWVWCVVVCCVCVMDHCDGGGGGVVCLWGAREVVVWEGKGWARCVVRACARARTAIMSSMKHEENGCCRCEVSEHFSTPRRVPQPRDTEKVAAVVPRKPTTRHRVRVQRRSQATNWVVVQSSERQS